MYKCVPEEGCIRSDEPHSTTSNVTNLMFSSLDVCRTVCGRFGGLWPRPVTAVLSTQTVKMHPNYLRYVCFLSLYSSCGCIRLKELTRKQNSALRRKTLFQPILPACCSRPKPSLQGETFVQQVMMMFSFTTEIIIFYSSHGLNE